jgi:hypothetical protein
MAELKVSIWLRVMNGRALVAFRKGGSVEICCAAVSIYTFEPEEIVEGRISTRNWLVFDSDTTYVRVLTSAIRVPLPYGGCEKEAPLFRLW